MKFISRVIDWLTTPYTVFLLLKDPAIPGPEKWRAVIGLVLIFAYIVSPLDIVPDFVPLSGWVDDLVIIPLGIALLRKITPDIDIEAKKNRAQKGVKRIVLRTVLCLGLGVLAGLAWLGLLIYLIIRWTTG